MPAFKFDFSSAFPPLTVVVPPIRYVIQLKGEVTVQQEGLLQNFSVANMKQLAAEAKHSADIAVGEIGSRMSTGTEVSFDPSSGLLDVKTSLSAELTIAGETWVKVSTSPVPPNGFKFTYQPRAVSGKVNNHNISGQIGLEITAFVDPMVPTPAERPAPVRSPNSSVNWQKVGAVGMFVLAAGIIVATLVEDVVTLGAGIADDPASFAGAAAAVSTGVIMWQGMEDEGIRRPDDIL
jgi:hypothetical protein